MGQRLGRGGRQGQAQVRAPAHRVLRDAGGWAGGNGWLWFGWRVVGGWVGAGQGRVPGSRRVVSGTGGRPAAQEAGAGGGPSSCSPRAPSIPCRPVLRCPQRDVTTSKQIAAALRIFKANNVPADVIKASAHAWVGGGRRRQAKPESSRAARPLAPRPGRPPPRPSTPAVAAPPGHLRLLHQALHVHQPQPVAPAGVRAAQDRRDRRQRLGGAGPAHGGWPPLRPPACPPACLADAWGTAHRPVARGCCLSPSQRRCPATAAAGPARAPCAPPRPPPRPQNRQWTEALPRLVRWIVPRDSSSPFNLVSDESQIWQGAAQAPPGAAAGSWCQHAGWRPRRRTAAGRPAGLAARALCSPAAAGVHTSPRPAELNMAWSQHEIVADYVRPTLMWLEARGRPAGGETLASLVAKYGLEASGLSCLTEDTEGCAARRCVRCPSQSAGWLAGWRGGSAVACASWAHTGAGAGSTRSCSSRCSHPCQALTRCWPPLPPSMLQAVAAACDAALSARPPTTI